jgi:hypothetical protein
VSEAFQVSQDIHQTYKAAYISLVDKKLLEIPRSGARRNNAYYTLKMVVRHRKLEMQMKYCRKIFASVPDCLRYEEDRGPAAG